MIYFIQNICPMYEDDKIILLIIIIDDLKKICITTLKPVSAVLLVPTNNVNLSSYQIFILVYFI